MNTNSKIYLVRHGETEWSLNGRHTSTTDLPLTPEGLRRAALLKPFFEHRAFALVLCSPRLRARQTATALGLEVELDPALAEWNYGDYEGLTTAEIQSRVPGWTVFSGSCPNGESADEVGVRVDRVIERARAASGDVLLVAHSHCLRVLVARWLGLEPRGGRFFRLDTGTWSRLGWEHGTPVIDVWSAPPEVR